MSHLGFMEKSSSTRRRYSPGPALRGPHEICDTCDFFGYSLKFAMKFPIHVTVVFSFRLFLKVRGACFLYMSIYILLMDEILHQLIW